MSATGMKPVPPDPVKEWATARAQAALAGWTLHRVVDEAGRAIFYAARWGRCKELHSIEEAQEFIAGVARPRAPHDGEGV